MKIFFALFSMISLAVLVGCSSALREEITSLEGMLSAMEWENVAMREETEEQRDAIRAYHAENERLEYLLYASEGGFGGSADWWTGGRANEGEIIENFLLFFASSGFQSQLIQHIGRAFPADSLEFFAICNSYVFVRESEWFGARLFFNYAVDEITGRFAWNWFGYDVYWLPWLPHRFTLLRELPSPRSLSSAQNVTVRFHQLNPDDWDEVYYIEEVIQGAELWTETIRLSQEHLDTMVRDLWYDGNTLYVDFKLGMLFEWNVGLGSVFHARTVVDTFYTFPGVQQVIFLLDGLPMPVIYNGWCMNTRVFIGME